MKKSFRQQLELLQIMTEREYKTRYKRAIMGFLWVIINPLLQMIIIGLIFSLFIKTPNYYLFLFSGLLPWQFFSMSLSKNTSSFVNERSLLHKANFTKLIIPTSLVLSNFINLLISITLLLIFLISTHQLILPNILLLIIGLLWLLLFTLSLSIFTATLNVKYRDVTFFTQTIIILWFYATPILYDLSHIPSPYSILFALNPLTSIFELFHIGVVNQGTIPSNLLILNIVSTFLIAVLAAHTYRHLSPKIVDWL